MCCGCWEEDGRHQLDTPAVRAVQALIEAVYAHSCVGGNLHIALDDNNLEDHHLAFCAAQIASGGYPGRDTPEQLAADDACCKALQAMSYEERVSALGLWDGCWQLPDSDDTVAGR